ncbi:hypothetical protein [Dysgonomonas sp. ZJ279]|uniref:hypothetical protein n=1 Tax=Dysgonomonas sp. ZJ279 TaxID=2709796 RepID=UPI0013EDF8D7|nr:hypothetical protein [Dysgonomonas sp. ZJ279]
MKKLLIIVAILLTTCSLNAQVKKLVHRINSTVESETIEFRYNAKNQLVFFSEMGIAFYREYSLKYDKSDRLVERNMNRDRGDIITNIRYTYTSPDYVTENVSMRGKLQGRATESNRIHIDSLGRLTKTTFADEVLWEEFNYDNNNNLTRYIFHFVADGGQRDIDYTYGNDISPFANIQNLPEWFWAYHMNNLKWCAEFMGKNSATSFDIDDTRVNDSEAVITYEYDQDGYPVKQFYNGEIAREFVYRKAQ